MDEQDRYVGLVQRAQQGDQAALGELADLKLIAVLISVCGRGPRSFLNP